jgi:hypothetical protein
MLNNHFGTNFEESAIKSLVYRLELGNGLNGVGLSDKGIAHRFQKGHVPANKGKKGTGGWEPTQFKKGQVPVNYRPVGSERVNVDGYIEVKVADPNKWRSKHVVIWEEQNGPVPKGHVLIFGNGNKLDLSLDNLLLVSRAQLAVLNKHKLIQNDAELTRTAIAIADVKIKISQKQKQAKENKRRPKRAKGVSQCKD